MLPNEHTFEFSQARLKAKSSLRFTMRQSGDKVWYLIEDEVTGKFFQIGPPQYTFLSMLDGRRTVSSALMKCASLLREHAIDEREAASLCKWAIESGLVETELSSSASRRAEMAKTELKRKSVAWLNPVTLKIPLFNPDSMVTALSRMVGWLVSPFGALVWMFVVFYGFFQLAMNWQPFVENRVSIFSANDFIWFAVAWVVLKLIHETSHSVVCKRFRGRVHSCGMLLLLMIPLPFVDVTSSWRFENKWHRILTSAAGMLAEIFVAAIACCVWVAADPGPLQYHAGNVIIAATLHTLIFNANPLMRFDGYYMLADWLEIPNLSTHGRQYVKSQLKWIYFGNKPNPLQEIGLRGLAVKVYGFLSVAWFFLISIGLMVGASSMMEGFGLLIAVIAVTLWFGFPVVKFVGYVIRGTQHEKPNRGRFAITMSLTLLIVAAGLYYIPGPSIIAAPVVVDYQPLHVVRAQSPGFVQQIHATNGAKVREGDLLLTLENRELVGRLSSLKLDIQISQLRIKGYWNAGDIASWKLEQETLRSLNLRREELETMVSRLEVRAQESGTVLALELDAKISTWLTPGDEILTIGDQEKVEAIALVQQHDIKWLTDHPDASVEFCFWGRSETIPVMGVATKLDPRVRDDLPHDGLSANNGGPLAVVPRSQVEGSHDQEDEGDMRLVNPRAHLTIEIPEKDRKFLLAGQTGLMLVRSRRQNLGSFLWDRANRFIRNANTRSHGL